MSHTINHAELQRLVAELLQYAGSEPAEAVQVSEHLIAANLKGHDSHGVGMIPHYIKNLRAGTMNPNTGVSLVKDAGAIMMFDGHRGYGQRVGAEMMTQLLERARTQGAVVATLRNVHHLGRIGTYAEMAVAAGMVSMHFVNVTGHPPLVAPFRGSQARFATNPIAIGIPGTRKREPFIMDMATSVVAMGKVRVAYNQEVPMEAGILVDAQGRPSTDPGVMYPAQGQPGGAILPFGLHKGYCLLFAAEMLAGVLGGGGTCQPENQQLDSIINHMLTVVIDPAHLVEPEWMEQELDAIRGYVLSSAPSDPRAPVLTPGDPERRSRAHRLEHGIPIDDNTWRELRDAAASVGYHLPVGPR